MCVHRICPLVRRLLRTPCTSCRWYGIWLTTPIILSDSATKATFPALYTQTLWELGSKIRSKLINLWIFLPLCLGMILGSQTKTGVVQYEAVELLFCLSFWLVLSKHRRLYKDLLPHLQKRTYSHAITQEIPYHYAKWCFDEHQVISCISTTPMF